jgi:hypothetical protein
MGWDGGAGPNVEADNASDYLMIVDASVNSTKLNWIINHAAEIDVTLDSDGTATTTVTLDYENPVSEWARGRSDYIIDKLMLGGQYGGYVRLFTPDRSRLISVSDGRQEIGVEEIAKEGGAAVFGRFFALQADDDARLVFKYQTPGVLLERDGLLEYNLHLQRQSGWVLDDVSLTASPPPGFRAHSAVVDGTGVTGPGAIPVDLTQDRLVTLRFESD